MVHKDKEKMKANLKENVNIWAMMILILAATIAAVLIPMALIVNAGYNGATWDVISCAYINIAVILVSGVVTYCTRD